MRKMKFSLIVLFLLLPFAEAITQQPAINIDFPTAGSTNISLNPILRISAGTGFRFDTTTLNFTGHELEMEWDTVNNRFYTAQFHVFDSEMYGNGSNDTNVIVSMFIGSRGYASLNDINHLTINLSNGLKYTKSYGFLIKDLRLINNSTEEVIIIDTIITDLFSSVTPIYGIEEVSVLGNVLLANEDITVKFNRSLPCDSTNAGRILNIRRVSGKEFIDSIQYTYTYQDVNSDTWLSEDNESITIKPDEDFDIDEEYILDVNLGYLTGDEKDNLVFNIFIKEISKFTITTRSSDREDPLPLECEIFNGNGEYWIKPDSQKVIRANKYFEEFMFLGWECPENDTINGNRNNPLEISRSVDELEDLNITAVYTRIPKDTLQFATNTGGTTRLVVTADTTGNNTLQLLPRKEGNEIYIKAIPDPGYRFVAWESSDSTIDGNTNNNLLIPAFVNKTEDQLYSKQDKRNFDSPMSGFEYPARLNPIAENVTAIFEPVQPNPLLEKQICIHIRYDEPGETTPSGWDITQELQSVWIHYGGDQNPPIQIKDLFTVNSSIDAEYCRYVCELTEDCTTNVTFSLLPSCYEIEFWEDVSEYGSGEGSQNSPIPGHVTSFEHQYIYENIVPRNYIYINVYIRKKRYNIDVTLKELDGAGLYWREVVGDPQIENATQRKEPECWTAISAQTGERRQYVNYFYVAKCNSTPTITPILLKTDRGYLLDHWDTGNDEDCIINDITDRLSIQYIDEDKDYTYYYKTEFLLEKVAYMSRIYLNDGGTPKNPDEWITFDSKKLFGSDKTNYDVALNLETNVSNDNIYPGYQHSTTQVRLYFNKIIDPNSINAQTLWAEDVLPTGREEEGRYADWPLLVYRPYNNIEIDNEIIENKSVVTFTLLDPNGVPILKMSPFKLHISQDLRSIDNSRLKNPQVIFKLTELPTLYLKAVGFYHGNQNDGLFQHEDEVIVSCGATCKSLDTYDTKELNNLSNYVKAPGSGFHDISSHTLFEFDLDLMLARRLNKYSILCFGANATDVDAGEVQFEWSKIVDYAKSLFKLSDASTWSVGANLGASIAKYIEGPNNDDLLGDISEKFYESSSLPWSCKYFFKWYNKNYYVNSHDFRFKIILY